MRTLGKLKLMAVSAMLVLGMTSCFKNENKFVIYSSPAYVLQEGSRYTLQIQVTGSDQIKSASASLNNKNFTFSAVEGTQNFVMQLNSYSASMDTVTAGLCTVTAYNTEGKSASSQLSMESTDKKIGMIDVTTLSYSGSDNKVTLKWNAVENAETYYLLYKITDQATALGDNMWLPYTSLTVNDKNNPSATATIPFTPKGKYQIAIGASYKTTLRVSERTLHVTGGEDASL